MKIIFIFFLIFFSNYIFANEEDNNEVEVIDLYENKSLDQMVLENLNGNKEIEEEIDNLNESNATETKKNEIEENETSKNYFKNFTKRISSSFRKSTIKY